MSHSDTPHPAAFEGEPLARQLHRSLSVTMGTTASYALGAVKIKRVGFADLPRLTITAYCKQADLGGVIPVARQQAFAYLAERGVDDSHLSFTPSVATASRRARFTDQHGKGRMGEVHTISFDLSQMLASAVEWDWRGQGNLPANWEL